MASKVRAISLLRMAALARLQVSPRLRPVERDPARVGHPRSGEHRLVRLDAHGGAAAGKALLDLFVVSIRAIIGRVAAMAALRVVCGLDGMARDEVRPVRDRPRLASARQALLRAVDVAALVAVEAVGLLV